MNQPEARPVARSRAGSVPRGLLITLVILLAAVGILCVLQFGHFNIAFQHVTGIKGTLIPNG
jgi:hypothetical protein